MTVADQEFLRGAIAKAREGVRRGQSPFGTSIVMNGEVLCCVHNQVLATCDSTAHAEMVAIREACRRRGSIDLSGATLYSTCEPCPMCFSACHWAKISRVVYGARISDAQAAGFSELTIPAEHMRLEGGSPLLLEGDVLREEALALFREWQARPDRQAY